MQGLPALSLSPDVPSLASTGRRQVGSMSASWSHWEMHPEGDEVVYLLSGSVDMVLEMPNGAGAVSRRVVELRGRGAVVIPKGVWHTALVLEPGEFMSITRGAGTQHRPA